MRATALLVQASARTGSAVGVAVSAAVADGSGATEALGDAGTALRDAGALGEPEPHPANPMIAPAAIHRKDRRNFTR